MFPQQSMDSFLKLKLELVYKDLPIEAAEQRFNALKTPTVPEEPKVIPVPKKTRKLNPKKK
jgi:hypothetical protein